MSSSDVGFFLVDVFAAEPLTGNPLALVPHADHLPASQMRAIAREFNQSETTFLVRPTVSGADWRLRSFTPAGVEVLGAGHNAMGAWLWLALSETVPADQSRFRQQIGDDLLNVEVTRGGGAPFVTMDQSAPRFGAPFLDVGALADALGVDVGEIAVGPADAARVVSTGVDHLLVRMRDRAAVDRAAPDSSRLLSVLRASGGEGCYVYAIEGKHAATDTTAYARFFNPTVGIAEDPATGTAAGPLVALLVDEGVVPDGTRAIVEQGTALGRPSRLEVTVSGSRVRLSGSGVVTASGVLHLSDLLG